MGLLFYFPKQADIYYQITPIQLDIISFTIWQQIFR